MGKTAIVEGLAQRLVKDKPHIPGFDDPVLLSLDVAGFLTGTQYRGAFAEKMKSLKEEVAAVREKVILFIDEIHTIAMPRWEGAGEISRELKDALARGDSRLSALPPPKNSGSLSAPTRRFPAVSILSTSRNPVWKKPMPSCATGNPVRRTPSGDLYRCRS